MKIDLCGILHLRPFVRPGNERGLATRFDSQRAEKLLELFLAEHRSHGGDAQELALEGIEAGGLDDAGDLGVGRVLPAAAALHDFEMLILGAGEKGEVKLPVENSAAMGNAWFATDIHWAANANEELDALSKVNLRTTAVVAKADFGFLKAGGEGTVKLTSYEADEAKYEVESEKGGLVIFSEVYYPGWTATIDGQPAEVGRANYVLRAVNVPAGKHEVVFTFKPQTVNTTETIAYVALGVLVLLIVVAVILKLKGKKKV